MDIGFSKLNYCTNQEIEFLVTAILKYKNINSLIICKLNISKYNSDVSQIIVIEEDRMIILITKDSLKFTGTIKLLNKVSDITNLTLCAETLSDFTRQSINEIAEIISKIAKLEKFTFRANGIPTKTMENITNCLNISITTKTVRVLNSLCIRNFDFKHKTDRAVSQSVEEIEKHQWYKIYIVCALRNNVNMRTLDLSSIAITEEVPRYLAALLHKIKIESLSLKGCSLCTILKSICLQKITTLKYLDLSNNHLTEHELIIKILESNSNLEKLFIDKNYLPPITGDLLSVAIVNIKNLKVLSVDQSIIKDNKLATVFCTTTNRKLNIYDEDHQSTEVLDVTGSIHNINTLTLYKQSGGIKNTSSFSAVLKTGVVLIKWQQDNAMCKAEVIRLLRTSVNITTIKLLNFSGMKLTEQEEDTIGTIVKENTQLENIWLGS